MKRLSCILIGALVLNVGCSSAPKTELEKATANQVGQEKIVSRIDDLTSRPSWLKEEMPFIISGNKVYSLGMTVIPADHNLSAAYRIAENNSKASISSAIESRLDFVFQNAEESTTMGTSQARYIGAEASKLTTNSLRLSKRYWEKLATVQENNQVSLQYRVFVLTEMPEQDFKVAITDAIRRSQGKQGLSAEFAKKVDQHWDSFVNATPKQDERKPTAATPDSAVNGNE